jgi:hypothetical protein
MRLTHLRGISLAVITLLCCAALSACGATGGTSRFVLPLDLETAPRVDANVYVASAAMEANAAYLQLVKVQKWGKFGSDDLKNIERSLKDTTSQYVDPASRPTGSRMDLHLVIRRYAVGTSNTAGAVLVCVAWAATTPNGSLIYEEQFFASNAGYLVTTIGLIKDSVHKAIVRRIATTSLLIAQDGVKSLQPRQFDKTSTTFEEAASRLPQTMVSLRDPSLVAFRLRTVSAVGRLTSSGVSTVEWTVASQSDAFDWTGYLAKLYEP